MNVLNQGLGHKMDNCDQLKSGFYIKACDLIMVIHDDLQHNEMSKFPNNIFFDANYFQLLMGLRSF